MHYAFIYTTFIFMNETGNVNNSRVLGINHHRSAWKTNQKTENLIYITIKYIIFSLF